MRFKVANYSRLEIRLDTLHIYSPAAGSHDDESKPLCKRRRLLQKHRVDVPLEDAIRAEITSYICNVKQIMKWTKILCCSGRPMCSLNT